MKAIFKPIFKVVTLASIFVLLWGCSAQQYLNMALRKDPNIIDVKADTTTSISVQYKDTSIAIEQKQPFKLVSDTAYKDSLVFRDTSINKGPIRAWSKDSIAFAQAEVRKGRLIVKAYAIVDTILTLRDTIRAKNRTIKEKNTIIKSKEATITEKETLAQRAERWAIIFGILFTAGLVFYLLNKLGFFRSD